MNLVELIKYLTNPERLGELYREKGVDTGSEALLIYLQKDLNLDSDVDIFEIQQTEDALLFEKDGVQYVQLFRGL